MTLLCQGGWAYKSLGLALKATNCKGLEALIEVAKMIESSICLLPAAEYHALLSLFVRQH